MFSLGVCLVRERDVLTLFFMLLLGNGYAMRSHRRVVSPLPQLMFLPCLSYVVLGQPFRLLLKAVPVYSGPTRALVPVSGVSDIVVAIVAAVSMGGC